MRMHVRLVLLLVGLLTFLLLVTAQPPATPNFSKDVAPILFKNCASCHRPGEIAPMSLLTYEQARPYARSIAERVRLGTMPPWHAEERVGTFANERRLSAGD